jgi:peptidyl-tRNA hydrolase
LGAGLLNYHRVRIGIGRPAPSNPIPIVNYLLAPYSDAELGDLNQLMPRIAKATERMVGGDVIGAMNEFNRT